MMFFLAVGVKILMTGVLWGEIAPFSKIRALFAKNDVVGSSRSRPAQGPPGQTSPLPSTG